MMILGWGLLGVSQWVQHQTLKQQAHTMCDLHFSQDMSRLALVLLVVLLH